MTPAQYTAMVLIWIFKGVVWTLVALTAVAVSMWITSKLIDLDRSFQAWWMEK